MKKDTMLHRMVRANFRSVRELANQLGWGYSKTYRIVTGAQVPSVVEAWSLAGALELDDLQQIRAVLICPYLSTKEDERAERDA